jgi:hypothetical protein
MGREREIMPFRTSQVRMYYAVIPTNKTPTPIVELRAFLLTSEPLNMEMLVAVGTQLEAELNFLEYWIPATYFSIVNSSVSYETMGTKGGNFEIVNPDTPELRTEIRGSEENRLVDEREAMHDLNTTGLSRVNQKFNQIYRYVQWFKKNKTPTAWNEATIREKLKQFMNPSDLKYYARIPYRQYLKFKARGFPLTSEDLSKFMSGEEPF